MNNMIYHYCSVDIFNLIISNKSIRLSDLNKTNDYMEKKWASNIVLDIIQDELSKLGLNINLSESYAYWDGVNSHIDYLEEQLNDLLLTSDPILISCFSKSNDKLSQWRAYGQDGYGVSIGFDLEKIKMIECNSNNIYVDKVIYNEKSQKNKIAKCIEKAVDYMSTLYEEIPLIADDFNAYFREEFDGFCEFIVGKLEEVSCCIKNPAFAEEDEVRIVYNPHLYRDMSDENINELFKTSKKINNYIINPIKFYSKDNMLVAYSDINFSRLINSGIIKEIILGPKCKLQEDDILYFLLSNGYEGYDIVVKKSNSTYR